MFPACLQACCPALRTCIVILRDMWHADFAGLQYMLSAALTARAVWFSMAYMA